MKLSRRKMMELAGGCLLCSLSAEAAERTSKLQALIDKAADGDGVVSLEAGTYLISTLHINSTIKFEGIRGRTVLSSIDGAPLLSIKNAADVVISGIVFDSQNLKPADGAGGAGGTSDDDAKFQLHALECQDILIEGCIFRNAKTSALGLDACTGRVVGNQIYGIEQAGILGGRFYGNYASHALGTHTVQPRGMEITGNHVHDIGNNGIMLKHYGPTSEEDGSIISNNHVEGILSGSGNGQHGNGIYVFASDNVIVSNNRITNCDYSAIRNASSKHVTISNNSISRISENAIFVEFAFESTMVSGNVVEDAFRGIQLSGGDGVLGYSGICSNNIVRNINRPTLNPDGGKFMGIMIASINTVAIGNVIENVGTNADGPGIGLLIQDWKASHYHSAQNNMIKNVGYGIGVVLGTGDGEGATTISVTGNTIADASISAIQLLDPSFTAVGGDQAARNTLPKQLHLSDNIMLE
jgi:uncharacterized secreted repeat protein (TIGR03808 family)